MLTDKDLLIAIEKGGSAADDAIRHLYREYFGLLANYVTSNNGDEQDAEDIFQDVVIAFINLARGGKFRGESSIKTFLYTLNRNIWLNELKRRGRAEQRKNRYESLGPKLETDVHTALEYRQTTAELTKVISQLGEVCKKILLLFYYENWSMKERLEQLDYENEQVVRNKKSKCLKQMEQLVQKNEGLYQQLKTLVHG
jgi:RNA polymerase sigma factor (sigma-70 family)